MEQTANRGSVFLPYLYSKIEGLPSIMQEEILLFTDFLISKNGANWHNAKTACFDEAEDEDHFANLSFSSLSKEWDTSDDEEWDVLLSQMPSIQ